MNEMVLEADEVSIWREIRKDRSMAVAMSWGPSQMSGSQQALVTHARVAA